MDRYYLWWNHEKKGEWDIIEVFDSKEDTIEFLESFLESNLKSSYKCSIFKIEKSRERKWINYLPTNIMKGGNK